MADLNAFNEPDEYIGDAVVAIVCALVGIAAIVVSAFVSPRLAIALSWLLVLGGVVIAVARPARRPVAAGLVFGGAAQPVAMFLWFWVWISGGVLFG